MCPLRKPWFERVVTSFDGSRNHHLFVKCYNLARPQERVRAANGYGHCYLRIPPQVEHRTRLSVPNFNDVICYLVKGISHHIFDAVDRCVWLFFG
jgi:hypothetical protein